MRSILVLSVGVFLALSPCAMTSQASAAPTAQIRDPDGGEVRGFVIGIDAYRHVRQLKGAVADARDIEHTLKEMGVRDVVTMINEQATRAQLLREMSAMVERTNANDLIFLSIAGHGTQEPERVKGSQPNGLENVFLLPDFEPTAEGSQQRVLGSEFNHFIKQFELRGAKVVFIADTCHGGGMARSIDPRAEEMSFRQVPQYTLLVDTLKPVSDPRNPETELDLDRTAFLAAVDQNTKAPEVRIPGIDGLRGALSYAVSRALEGNADANNDGKVTVKELFDNVRQVVYQLSDQRQTIVTLNSPGQPLDSSVVDLTRGVTMVGGPNALPASLPAPAAVQSRVADAPPAATPAGAPKSHPPAFERMTTPIRVASLDGNAGYFSNLKSKDATVKTVSPTDNPDLIWDPTSHDAIAWGDVVAYNVDAGELSTVVDRTAAIRELKRFSTKSPQVMRISPDDRQHRSGQTVEVNLSDVAGRAVVLFNISGDGATQLLYPLGSDASPVGSKNLRLPLRVREPFGAEQIVAITSSQRMPDLEQVLAQLNGRRLPGQVIKSLQRSLPADARVGSVGFFSAP
ncbi:MAG: caspase family protein [Proteobacteria bacterium]|nr:caspase family protein [Pseudomonadota bacterium]